MEITQIPVSKYHYKWVTVNDEDEEVSEENATRAIELVAMPNGEDDMDIEESGLTLKRDINGWWIENI